ncbi:MAG TPA: site-specific integrase [Jatrophihabitans sp.]|nr:site-specific integrase [Jatrophihabitans sp.]
MTTSEHASVAPTPSRLSPPLDHDAWVAFLQDRLAPEGQWRPGEFDLARWLFTGDPDNPRTTSTCCRVTACDTVVTSHRICNQCSRAFARSGLSAETFTSTYQPVPARQRRTGEPCLVIHDGVACQRRRISERTGLCHAHTGRWYRTGYRRGLSVEAWRVTHALPLPAQPACQVPDCAADANAHAVLCHRHAQAWRTSQAKIAAERRVSSRDWVAAQREPLRANQFSLAGLAPTLRQELLYVLQQRDAQGQRIDPLAVRGLVGRLAGLDTLVTVTAAERRARIGKPGIVACYARLAWRIIDLTFENFRGLTHTDRDVWDCLALDLQTPRPGRRPNRAVLDFTPISQPWLREATKHWVATALPSTYEVKRAVQAATVVSCALARRPGGGKQAAALGFAEVTLAYEAIKSATRTDGQLHDSHFRRGLWARFWGVIDLARASGLLDELPGTFIRHSSHRIVDEQTNEDQIGKAIPETVIAQLDAHLDLLEAGHHYGMFWSQADAAALFRASYLVLRDTGRRPGEVVSLAADCLEVDRGEYALVYDNHKKKRLRRRLPIAADTAAGIQAWQAHRAGLLLPAAGRPWLFPACYESNGAGHLTTIRLGTALRRWVDAIPALHSDLPGPDGAPLPFDRSKIYAYAFRHSYAQRHADVGVGVEILKELMDHRDMKVTQSYYTVSLKRKRQAIAVMSRYVHDRSGTPITSSESVARYELRSVAVPFGNCIEPSNVKAGGKQCPIRFQCAGCGFYRPDPSYLPVIEDHVNALKADRETALAMDADEFVVRNLADQAAAFGQVAEAMRSKLQSLPEAERVEVEQASVLLRKVRAGRSLDGNLSGGRPLLPLTATSIVADRTEATA